MILLILQSMLVRHFSPASQSVVVVVAVAAATIGGIFDRWVVVTASTKHSNNGNGNEEICHQVLVEQRLMTVLVEVVSDSVIFKIGINVID